MTKKISLLFLICLLSVLNISAEIYSGSCGKNVSYTLDTETNVLSITGTGAMTNYNDVIAPWYSKRSYIKTVKIADGVTSIGSNAFHGCSNFTSVTIPNSVTSIGEKAFWNCTGELTVNCNIPSGAFVASKFSSVIIGDEVTSIGSYAFNGCRGLTSVIIPNNVTSIGSGAFGLCENLTSVTIPNSVTSIGNYAFESCNSLTSITIPNSVTSIGNYAFESCNSLTSITIPNSVTSIGKEAFGYCSSLTSINIPNSVTEIGESAFESCNSLKSINIPDGVMSIKYRTFYGCSSLTSINIPNSVTEIGGYSFYNCESLTEVTIGNSVKEIGERAFWGCTGLTSITSLNIIPPTLGIYCFPYLYSSYVAATLYFPDGCYDYYHWSSFRDYVQIEYLITISPSGYATFYSSNSAYILPKELYAQVIISESANGLVYETLNSNIIPKGVPVILVSKDKKGGTYALTTTNDYSSYTGKNLLRGSNVSCWTSIQNDCKYDNGYSSDYVFYKLAYSEPNGSNANTIGWYWGAENGEPFIMQGKKAWLALPKYSQKTRSSMLHMDGTPIIDGFNYNIKNSESENVYNIYGSKVNANYKGIIIKGNKKILMK